MTLQCWHVQKFKTFLCKILRDLKTQTTFPGILFRVTKQLWNGRGWEKFLGQRYIWEVERLGKKLCFERLGEVLGEEKIFWELERLGEKIYFEKLGEVFRKYIFWEVGRKDIIWVVGRSFGGQYIFWEVGKSFRGKYILSPFVSNSVFLKYRDMI